MRSALVLSAALALTACSSGPEDRGTQLAQRHVEALESGTLTLDRLDADLEKEEARFSTPEAKRTFRDAYSDGVEPVRRELAQLYVKGVEEELREAGDELGDGIGEAIDGMIEAIERSVEGLKNTESREHARDVGRRLGRIVKGLGEAIEAAAEGFEEEMESE
ncbi:MAG: hypothetical protein AAFZ18_07725 [Myxococcota bacterium]